jgi:hypothetical protein
MTPVRYQFRGAGLAAALFAALAMAACANKPLDQTAGVAPVATPGSEQDFVGVL